MRKDVVPCSLYSVLSTIIAFAREPTGRGDQLRAVRTRAMAIAVASSREKRGWKPRTKSKWLCFKLACTTCTLKHKLLLPLCLSLELIKALSHRHGVAALVVDGVVVGPVEQQRSEQDEHVHSRVNPLRSDGCALGGCLCSSLLIKSCRCDDVKLSSCGRQNFPAMMPVVDASFFFFATTSIKIHGGFSPTGLLALFISPHAMRSSVVLCVQQDPAAAPCSVSSSAAAAIC